MDIIFFLNKSNIYAANLLSISVFLSYIRKICLLLGASGADVCLAVSHVSIRLLWTAGILGKRHDEWICGRGYRTGDGYIHRHGAQEILGRLDRRQVRFWSGD